MSNNGKKAFRRCDVKVVEFKDFVYDKDAKNRKVLSDNPSEDTRRLFGYSAVLHCPRTEDDRVSITSQFTNHSSRIKALKSVEKLAGALLCRDCRFSNLTPAEVSMDRAALARAEKDRIEATRIRQEAIRELIESTGDPNWE
jgi:hypothetical protein